MLQCEKRALKLRLEYSYIKRRMLFVLHIARLF